MAFLRRLRTTTAYVVWWLCVLLALTLVGAALLVALRAESNHVVWGPWLSAAESVTFGWFARPEPGPLAAAQEGPTVLRWGAAALAVLGVGALVQWVVRPPRP